MYMLLLNWEDIKLTLLGVLRTFLLSLCDIIYKLIVFTFDIFEKLGSGQILSDIQSKEIYERVGVVLGLFMVFRLTLVFIQYVLNPDLMTDKNKGAVKIITRVVTSIVLLGITPFIFKTAQSLQNLIMEENIIPAVITGEKAEKGNFGGELAWYTFSTFYYPDEKVQPIDNQNECPEFTSGIIEKEIKDGNFGYAYNCINLRGNRDYEELGESRETFVINFDGFLSTIVGIIVLYIILVYTINAGIRVIQLAYLQIIAPIPIMMYIEPNDNGMFQKWVKQCISTYLDYFIRIAIIYFVDMLIKLIMETDNISIFFNSLGGLNHTQTNYVTIIMIIALLMFAKKVPELLKELFPSLGGTAGLGFDFKMPKEARAVIGFGTGAVVGGAVGLVGGHGIGGRIKGLLGGVTRGSYSGAQGKKLGEIASSRAKQNKINRQNHHNSSTFGGRLNERLRNEFGFESGTEKIDRQISNIDNSELMRQKKRNDAIISARKAIVDEAKNQLLSENGPHADARLKGMRDQLNYLREHVGERDSRGVMITHDRVNTQETAYNHLLDREVENFTNANAATNAEIAKNIQVIQNNSVPGTTITNFNDATTARNTARTNNATIARDVVNSEHRKEELNEQKRQTQANENAIKK